MVSRMRNASDTRALVRIDVDRELARQARVEGLRRGLGWREILDAALREWIAAHAGKEA